MRILIALSHPNIRHKKGPKGLFNNSQNLHAAFANLLTRYISGNLVPKHIVLPIQDASHWLAFTLTNPTNFTIPYSVYIKQGATSTLPRYHDTALPCYHATILLSTTLRLTCYLEVVEAPQQPTSRQVVA